ncbi:MAG TPA: lysophospholipid acyltransferase family protein [Nevskiaceae bacterium]|nr:lysophospholipid acyltransferase family protein [Nevskiaceae bacterium]
MIVACYRGLRVLVHLCVGLVLALALALDWRGRLKPEKFAHWWSSVLLDIFNIRLVVHGAPAAGARMTVANHVSWLDIPLIAACEPTRFVAKSEVQRWPIAGWLADAGGTFYIRRGKGGSKPLLHKLTPHLARGGNVTVFPEGTTTDGREVLEFHPRLFAAAIDAACAVQPVAIRYGLGARGANVAPFIGDDDLVSHILRLLREPELTAEVRYCAPLQAIDLQRDELADAARTAVCAALAQPAAVPLEEVSDLLAA